MLSLSGATDVRENFLIFDRYKFPIFDSFSGRGSSPPQRHPLPQRSPILLSHLQCLQPTNMATTAEEYPGVQPYPDEGDHDPSILKEVIQFSRHRPDVGLPMREGPKLFPFRPFGVLGNLEWVREVAVTGMSVVWKVKVDEQFYALKLVSFSFHTTLVTTSPVNTVNHTVLLPTARPQGALQPGPRYSHAGHVRQRRLQLRSAGVWSPERNRHRKYRHKVPRICSPDPFPGEDLQGAVQRHPVGPDPSTRVRGVPNPLHHQGLGSRGHPDFTPKMVPRMKRDLITLHSVGIINRDIKWNNYLGGKMFDCGIAWTVPHFTIYRIKRSIAEGLDDAEYRLREWQELRDVDGDRFDAMIDESNMEGQRGWIWERFFPNHNYFNLRRCHEVLADRPIKTPNPLEYRWVWNESVKKLREKTNKSSKGHSVGVKKRKAKRKGQERKK